MNIKTKILMCIIIILVYCFISNYTTTLFKVNKYNTYSSDDIKFKNSEDVAQDFISLMIDNKFDEAYKLLGEKTKVTFKSSNELKEYFINNYSNINKMKDGILIHEKYSRVDKGFNTYNCVIVSKKYSSPKNYDPMHSENEFNVFSSITIYEKTPMDYTIEINI
jgi:uncharacterized protein YxeA